MIILYPTDTIYGLGVDATDPTAIRALKELKGRPEDKHISIAVSDVAMMQEYAEVTPLAKKLIKAFLPGKLTIVLKPRNLPVELGVESGEIGIRIPNHPAPLALIRELGKPIPATSANVSGMPSLPAVSDILKQFGGKASLITRVINGGILPPSEPSTVVDARGVGPVIIREGAILALAIQKAVV